MSIRAEAVATVIPAGAQYDIETRDGRTEVVLVTRDGEEVLRLVVGDADAGRALWQAAGALATAWGVWT